MTSRTKASSSLSKAKLAEMCREATVDAYDDAEQAMGWFGMFEEHLALPFETKVLGVVVSVTDIELRDAGLVAICEHGRHRQAILLIDVPLPSPKPAGADWIEAYRSWLRGRYEGRRPSCPQHLRIDGRAVAGASVFGGHARPHMSEGT